MKASITSWVLLNMVSPARGNRGPHDTRIEAGSTPPPSALRLLPDPPVVHQLDLPLDDLLAVLRVLHGLALEIEVLRIDRLLVEELVELGAEVLHPVVPLGARAMVTQGLDVDHAADVGRSGA